MKFCDLVWPKDFSKAEQFAAAVEAAVRKGYSDIAVTEGTAPSPASPGASKEE